MCGKGGSRGQEALEDAGIGVLHAVGLGSESERVSTMTTLDVHEHCSSRASVWYVRDVHRYTHKNGDGERRWMWAGKHGGTLFVALATMLALLMSGVVIGAPLENVPVEVVQPDGQVLKLFASGDEFYNWVHDGNGFTVVRDPNTGYVEYAVLQDGELIGSGYRVGSVDPTSIGLEPAVNLPPERVDQMRQMSAIGPEALPNEPERAPTSGMINNLVVFIRFAGESEFTDAISTYNGQFNTWTASMDNYFQETSYNALSISTTFYPVPPGLTVVSYQDAFARPYYEPYNAVSNLIGYENDTDSRYREHALLKNATDAVSGVIPAGLNLDGDSDGLVDNVCYIVYGSPGAWSDLLWPHKWDLGTGTWYEDPARPDCRTYINGKQVWTYNFQLQSSLASSGVGVLCHEMFHSLGAPDLYHYPPPDPLHPIGTWGLMEYSSNPPRHMSAYMKYQYGGWIASIPEITPDGSLYTLNPLTSATGQCYKIASNNSPTEYFVVEYRRDTGTFESSLSGSGLLVYRINTSVSVLDGNMYGPPDRVYIYRPGGTTLADGNWYTANFSSDVGRTAINDSTNPSSFLTDGSPGGLSIYDIGSAGSTISFRLGPPPPPATPAVFRVTSDGTVLADQTFYGASFQSGSADVAEWVQVSEPVEAGDVLELDPDNPQHYRKSTGACSALLAGVVSSEPGVILGVELPFLPTTSHSPPTGSESPPTAFLALIGIVPVKACDEGGPIELGDLLVPASIPGYVRRWDPVTDGSCPFVGKALTTLVQGESLILTLLVR